MVGKAHQLSLKSSAGFESDLLKAEPNDSSLRGSQFGRLAPAGRLRKYTHKERIRVF